eukprot:366038-Chlamydomonas_euryale.AAC.3
MDGWIHGRIKDWLDGVMHAGMLGWTQGLRIGWINVTLCSGAPHTWLSMLQLRPQPSQPLRVGRHAGVGRHDLFTHPCPHRVPKLRQLTQPERHRVAADAAGRQRPACKAVRHGALKLDRPAGPARAAAAATGAAEQLQRCICGARR